jgi:hypothetical protein
VEDVLFLPQRSQLVFSVFSNSFFLLYYELKIIAVYIKLHPVLLSPSINAYSKTGDKFYFTKVIEKTYTRFFFFLIKVWE